MIKKLTLDEVKLRLKEINPNIEILSTEYIGANSKLELKCRVDGHIWFAKWSHLSNGHGCPACGGNPKQTLNLIKKKLKKISPNIEILSEEYINAHTKLKCKCLIDGHVWFVSWNNLLSGKGCPVCAGHILHDGNRLSILRPDLIKYFKDPEDTNNFAVSSNKKVTLKCPDCGKEKLTTFSNLSRRGFSCSHCSDGVSLGEKFGINLFKQLGIEFETQKIFSWSGRKRYDISFEMNKEVCIIEIHGEQHYKECESFTRKGLQSQIINDELKYYLAIQNAIKPQNYIIVDARNSEFDWLKGNFTKSLNVLFDLSNVDWNNIWLESQTSLVIKVCKYWKNKKEDETTTTLGNIFGLGRTTVRRYLKRGSELGLCTYSPEGELSKSFLNPKKPVHQYSLEGDFIKKWESASEAGRELGFFNSNISKCCNGKLKTAYGFKWSFIEPSQ